MVNTTEMFSELKHKLAFTKEELEELEAAKMKPITFDLDCSEVTPESAVKPVFHKPMQAAPSNGGRTCVGFFISGIFCPRIFFWPSVTCTGPEP